MKRQLIVVFLLSLLCVPQPVFSQEPVKGVEPDLSGETGHRYWGDVHGHTGFSCG